MLDPHERMDCLVVEITPWTVENGLITPTMKVKRNRLEEIYSPKFETWVVTQKRLIWNQMS